MKRNHWFFRTIMRPALPICALTVFLVTAPTFGQYDLVRANLHVHTSISKSPKFPKKPGEWDHKLCPTPPVTLKQAQKERLGVIGFSDHGGDINTIEWRGLRRIEQEAGGMVALRGFEWTHGGMQDSNHVNVFGTESYTDVCSFGSTQVPEFTRELPDLYAWLEGAKTTPDYNGLPIAQFNHIAYGNQFDSFEERDKRLDEIFCLAEIGCGEQAYPMADPGKCDKFYRQALAKGWHVAPSIGIDNQFPLPLGHQAAERHTAIWVVRGSGRAGVIEALKARRVFASEDRDARVSLKCTIAGEASSHWMGETIHPGARAIEFDIDVDVQKEPIGVRPHIFAELVCPNNHVIQKWDEDGSRLTRSYELSGPLVRELFGPSGDETCVFLRVHQKGKGPRGWIENDHIYSAPVWISRN